MEEMIIFSQEEMKLAEFQKAINSWLASKASKSEITGRLQSGNAKEQTLTITVFYKDKVK